MRMLGGAILAGAAWLLTGCSAVSVPVPTITVVSTPAADDGYQSANATCMNAYIELPYALEVISRQTGKDTTAVSACRNWQTTVGRADYIQFWTDSSKYMPFVANAVKLESAREASR